MRFAKTLMAAAAMSLAVAPAMANSASKLSISSSQPARATTVAGESNELRGGFIIPLVALVAVILGILAATSGDSEPDSP